MKYVVRIGWQNVAQFFFSSLLVAFFIDKSCGNRALPAVLCAVRYAMTVPVEGAGLMLYGARMKISLGGCSPFTGPVWELPPLPPWDVCCASRQPGKEFRIRKERSHSPKPGSTGPSFE